MTCAVNCMPKKALTGFELTHHDLGNMICLFFMTQFLLPCQKITISTHNVKKEKKFLKNACWIVSKILNRLFFQVNQLNQWYLLKNKLLVIIIILSILKGKDCFAQSSTIIIEIEAWLHLTFFICL